MRRDEIMSRWTEPEILVAYVDGALGVGEIRAVEEALASDAGARDTVRRLREDVAVLRAAFNDPLDEPLPERVVATLNAVSDDGKVTLLKPRAGAGGGLPEGWRLALACVFASGVVFFMLTFLRIRELIIDAIPASLKHAISVGI